MEECSHPAECFHGIPCSRSPCDSLLAMNILCPLPLQSAPWPQEMIFNKGTSQSSCLRHQDVRKAVWFMSHFFPFHDYKLMISHHPWAFKEGQLTQFKCSIVTQNPTVSWYDHCLFNCDSSIKGELDFPCTLVPQPLCEWRKQGEAEVFPSLCHLSETLTPPGCSQCALQLTSVCLSWLLSSSYELRIGWCPFWGKYMTFEWEAEMRVVWRVHTHFVDLLAALMTLSVPTSLMRRHQPAPCWRVMVSDPARPSTF